MGLLMASTITAAAFIDDDALIIAILSFAFFGQAMSSSGWTVISEVAPEGLLGLVGGLFSFAANLSGVVIPIVIGLIVQYTHSFFGALAFIGAIAAIGAFSWLFVVGRIERLELEGVGPAALSPAPRQSTP
jgi:ACS family D-galactonate transporter-like MFS transporter